MASAAVGLRPLQEANRAVDRKRHILYAAGLYDESRSIDELFAPIETRVVDLATGRFVPEDTIRPESYQQLKAALSDDNGRPLSSDEDIARLRRLEKYSLVYLVKHGEEIRQVVLPVRGKGLWSTMYAYVAVDSDLTTIRGISFYEHGETPGLGGEIENTAWQDGWRGKKIYTDNGSVGINVAKTKAPAEDAGYHIDGLSGATLTTIGVDNLMEFWFGAQGFKPFFTQLKKKDGNNG